ncbi:MAG TPA: glycosyltransferase family 9 protein [Ktedonobacterales bacterium]|nr:glycosyltransferase family 9 protein [Ktedonobacterales bacterium]
MRQITVIRPGALGDTLLTLPAIAVLRRWTPSARLTLIARADILSLALASGLADDAWPWDLPDWSALFAPDVTAEELTARARAALVGADVVIAWAPDRDGALAATLHRLGAGRVIVAPAQPSEAPGALPEHAAHWLARALTPLGVTPPRDLPALWQAMPPLRWPEPDARAAGRAWRALGLPDAGVIALHPGSGGAAKRWPPERFAALADRARQASLTPLLLAGEADEAAAAAVLAHAAAPPPIARDLSVGALAALLARCAGYVGNDSGVSHLAGLLGVPTVAVFGPSDPARWSPLGPRVTTLRAPSGDLRQLAPDAVWQALRASGGRLSDVTS